MTSLRRLEQLEKSIELEKCFRLQRKLAALSHSYENKRFDDLYNLTYWRPLVYTAVKTVRTRKGAKTPGIDGKTKDNINDDKLLEEICRELKAGTVQPSGLRKVEVPKPNSVKKRVLGIPTYKDRVILTIIKLILEPIYEPQFDASSYGFRPNRSTHDAIGEIKAYLGEKRRYAWVVESDVSNCFPSIEHGRLLQILEERIADGKMIQLIRKYLKASMAMEGFYDDTSEAEKGCPQGSPLSPLICNIYLDKLDQFVNKRLHGIQSKIEKDKTKLSDTAANRRRRRAYIGKKMRDTRTGPFHLIRYADDLVIVSAADKKHVEKYWQQVCEFAWQRLRLKFSPGKTSITHAADGLNFLGFRLRRIYRRDLKRRIVLVTVDPKRKQRHRESLRNLLKGGHQREVGSVIQATNQRIRGWRNYYQKSVTNCDVLNYIDQLAFWLLVKWLMKKFSAGIGKVFKVFYRRVRDKSGHCWKTLAAGDIFLDRAIFALPKHVFDFQMRHTHPWLQSKTAQQMLESSFPVRPRAPTWDGYSSYGESYAKMARKALERDKYKCVKCGETNNLNIHHINKRSAFANPKSKQSNCLENLVTLCRACHKFANRLNALDCLNWLIN